MVLLCMTTSLVAAIETCNAQAALKPQSHISSEPSLEAPSEGNPISHGQILGIRQTLLKLRDKSLYDGPCDLDSLLRGAAIWQEPPKPKAEPTDEYKALMARLRAEQEAQAYTRMLSTSPNYAPTATTAQTFAQRFPNSQFAHLFPDSTASLPSRLASAGQIPAQLSSGSDQSDSVLYDDASLATVNRQLALIGNILISIIATAVAIWTATWHWDTPARLGLSMGGSGLVGVAEIVVYLGYIQRLENAKTKETRKKERKQVTKTWVIEGRKGTMERRTVEVGGPGPIDDGKAIATGSWPSAPEGARKRVGAT